MPTYDYKCDACGNQFERFHSITSPAIRKCPKCGKLKVRRLIGPGAGLIFKGSGFYITDYRSEGYKSAARSESGATSDTSAASDGKSSGDKASSDKASSETKPANRSSAESTAKPQSKPAAKPRPPKK